MNRLSTIPLYASMYLVLLMGVLTHTSLAQYGPEDIQKRFETFRIKTLQEKIYVHTDRSAYLTGETMWFSIYLADGTFHRPLGLSKVVYLEITDADHSAVLQSKIAMEDGKGHGSLYLPASLQSGNYILRAYTNWMKNFPADYFFSKTITVVNTFRKLDSNGTNASSTVDLQFFPEGGHLVSGLESSVGFRGIDETGKGISFNGVVLDQQQDTVVSFSPAKAGIGSFAFTPQPGNRYRAVVRHANGSTTRHDLPGVQDHGYTLSARESRNGNIEVMVRAKGVDSQAAVHLFVHARNLTVFNAISYLSNGTTGFTISREKLPEGISHITLFDGQLRPVCERLWFKRPENLLKIDLSLDDAFYLNRRRVGLELNAVVNDRPKASNLSVSVYKLDSIATSDENIITSFWLTSDLAGTVEDPVYYFSENSAEVSRAVDNLMLTHGWRRFKWEDVIEGNVVTPFIPEYRGHIIRGTVVSEDGTPAPRILTYLSSPSKTIRLNTAVSGATGEVLFETQKFYGSSRVVVQPNYAQDSTCRVLLTDPFVKGALSRKAAPFSLNVNLSRSLLERSVAMQVQDIYFEEDLEATTRIATDISAFYGKADQSYYLDDYTRFPVMEEVLREYVSGVWVRKRRGGFYFILPDQINRTMFEHSPLMMIDGVPFFDANEIMQFDPLKVRQIEVFNRQYYLGAAVFPGLVSFRTYNGDLAGFPLSPKSTQVDYDGIQRQREFYSPRYDTGAQRRSRLPDQRTLLYWNPSVNTDANGKAVLEFFTSDVSGNFLVVVEGMTTEGNVGSTVSGFKVSGD